jgi:uncharacterized protein (DUF1697 family)
MKTYIALFRGINVGGKNILPMKELVRDLKKFDFQNVQTYIQSGNVIFQSKHKISKDLPARIAAAIEASHGFRPHILLIDSKTFRAAAEANPFVQAESEPKTLHLCFLESKPVRPDFNKLDELKSKTEKYKLIDSVFYLHAPDGIGRSKLAAAVEKNLGVTATGRNWNTVQKLVSIIESG